MIGFFDEVVWLFSHAYSFAAYKTLPTGVPQTYSLPAVYDRQNKRQEDALRKQRSAAAVTIQCAVRQRQVRNIPRSVRIGHHHVVSMCRARSPVPPRTRAETPPAGRRSLQIYKHGAHLCVR